MCSRFVRASSIFVAGAMLAATWSGAADAAAPVVTPAHGDQTWYDKFYISPGLGVVLFNSFAPSHDTLAPMLRVGYRVNDVFDLEVGGLVTRLDDRNDLRVAHDSFHYTQAYGTWLDAVFHLTRWERFDPYATLGVGEFWARDNALLNEKEMILTPRVGLGVMYHLNEHWSLRAGGTLMASDFRPHEHNFWSVIDVGVGYAFGGGHAPAAPVTAVPVVAPAPSLPTLVAEVKKMHEENAPLPEDLLLVTLELQFDFDVSIIKAEYYDQLDSIAKVLLNHPEASALIEGYCDQRVRPNGVRSSKEYNQRLSEQRAAMTVSYLVEKGIDASRLQSVGYGFTRPKDPAKVDLKNGNPENRRVEIYINNVGGTKAGEAEYKSNLKK